MKSLLFSLQYLPQVNQENIPHDLNLMQMIWRELVSNEEAISQHDQLGCKNSAEIVNSVRQFADNSKIDSLNPIAKQRLDALIAITSAENC